MADKPFHPSPLQISIERRRAVFYGEPKPVVQPVYGAGKATDYVDRHKKVYPGK